ncbi:hypothetical protein ACQ9BA_25910, partial [Escherichia coli]
PMGSTANIAGRVIAQNMMGAKISYRGTLGTAVCKLPGINVGRTGLTEVQAKEVFRGNHLGKFQKIIQHQTIPVF